MTNEQRREEYNGVALGASVSAGYPCWPPCRDITAAMVDAAPDTRSAAIEELAARLYGQTEKAMPGVEDFVPWANAPEATQRIYRGLIEDLARYGDLWAKLA